MKEGLNVVVSWVHKWPILLFAASFLLYGQTLSFDFNLDDDLVTMAHPRTSKGWSGFIEILKSPYYEDASGYSYEYRPVTHVSFALEHALLGGTAFSGHLLNILLYAFTSLVLFRVLLVMFPGSGPVFPVVATLLFVVHPMHVEAVASIKNREELLALLAGLGGVLFWGRFCVEGKVQNVVMAVLMSILGLLSKMSGFALIVLMPVLVAQGNVLKVRFWQVLTGSVLLTFSIIYLWSWFLPFTAGLIIVLQVLSLILLNKLLPNLNYLWHLGKEAGLRVLSSMKRWVLWSLQVVSTFVRYALSKPIIIVGAIAVLGILAGIPVIVIASVAFIQIYAVNHAMHSIGVYLSGLLLVGYIALVTGSPENDALYLFWWYVFYFSSGRMEFSVPGRLRYIGFTVIIYLVSVALTDFIMLQELCEKSTLNQLLAMLWFSFFLLIFSSVKYLPVRRMVLIGPVIALLMGAGWIMWVNFVFIIPFLGRSVGERTWRRGSYMSTLIMCLLLTFSVFSRMGESAWNGVHSNLFFDLREYVFSVIDEKGGDYSVGIRPAVSDNIYKQPVLADNEPSAQNVQRVSRMSEMLGHSSDRPLHHLEYPLGIDATWGQRIATAAVVIVHYTRQMFIPFPQSFYYGYSYFDRYEPDDIKAIVAFVVIAVMVLFGLWLTYLRSPTALGIWIFLASIVMFSNLIEPIAGMAADRLTYVASFGFCIAVGHGFQLARSRWRRPAEVMLLLTLVLFVGMTVYRTSKWKDRLTLMRNDVTVVPNSAQAHNLLASNLMQASYDAKGKEKPVDMRHEAIHHFRESLRIWPNTLNVWYDLGRAYMTVNEPASALPCFQSAYGFDSTFTDAAWSAALIAEQLGRDSIAIQYYHHCIRFSPELEEAYSRLSYLYFTKEEFERSIEVNRMAIAYEPRWPAPYENAAQVFEAMEMPDSVAFYIDKRNKMLGMP